MARKKANPATKIYCTCPPESYPKGRRLGFCFECRHDRPPITGEEIDAFIAARAENRAK